MNPVLIKICLALAIFGLLGILMEEDVHRMAEKVRKRDEQRQREQEWLRAHHLDNHNEEDNEDPTFDTGQYPPKEGHSE